MRQSHAINPRSIGPHVALPRLLHLRRVMGGKAFAKRLMGCAFPVGDNGTLATCRHCTDSIEQDEILVVQHPTETICHRVESTSPHPRLDISFITISAKTPLWPSPILQELLLTVPVFAYGFYDHTIEQGELIAIPQAYSGTITATPRRSDSTLATLLPFYQVSFPTFPGFSGSPLYAEVSGSYALAGMLFGNRSSKVVERQLDEYDDGKTRIIEKSVRIWECGIAHTCETLQKAASDLKKSIWP